MLHTYYDSAGRVSVARRGAAIINVLPGAPPRMPLRLILRGSGRTGKEENPWEEKGNTKEYSLYADEVTPDGSLVSQLPIP